MSTNGQNYWWPGPLLLLLFGLCTFFVSICCFLVAHESLVDPRPKNREIEEPMLCTGSFLLLVAIVALGLAPVWVAAAKRVNAEANKARMKDVR
jgi:formate hydrogenlyase subunit 3/multisubunit Na+/H+ antiporter MnhD subunit